MIQCRSCGFDISSSDDQQAAEKYVDSIQSCMRCSGRKFDIIERTRDVRVIASEESDAEDNDSVDSQQSLDEY